MNFISQLPAVAAASTLFSSFQFTTKTHKDADGDGGGGHSKKFPN
jgi:hypothetical protein